jgi:hypothetical protein
MQLTESDREILETLTHRVRVLTVRQVARTWFCDSVDPMRRAKRRLAVLQRAGHVFLSTVVAHPELPLQRPVLEWHPDDAMPDFGPIAYRLQSRWTSPVTTTNLVLAAHAARCRFGGYIAERQPRRSEVTHDLHLACVYLWYRHNRPELAKQWVSEHELYARGGGRNARLPDALIRDRRRRPGRDLVVEFGGSYSKQKLVEFHEELKETAYQIW